MRGLNGRFTGAAPEPRPGIWLRPYAGSYQRSLHWSWLEDGRLKPAERLRELFTAKGVDIGREPITTTCGSGVTAAVVALGLELAGAENVSLYDGSWAEYAQRPDAVIGEEQLACAAFRM